MAAAISRLGNRRKCIDWDRRAAAGGACVPDLPHSDPVQRRVPEMQKARWPAARPAVGLSQLFLHSPDVEIHMLPRLRLSMELRTRTTTSRCRRSQFDHHARSTPRAEAVSRPAAGLDVKKLFGEVDKFCAHILAIPAAANHPDIKKQLDFITAGKEKFETAYAEHLASLAKAHAQLDALAKTAQEQQEAHRKQIEELNRPWPPLDGNALGRALLKNLGLSTEPSEQTTQQRCAHPPALGSERAELLHGS